MIEIDLKNLGRLANKIAVITGSPSGIGRAITLAFAAEGASPICSDLREEAQPEYATDASTLTTVQEAAALGAKAIFVKCDTSSATDVEALIKKAVKVYGRVDIMVNNAGVSVEMGEHGSRPMWECEESAFEKTMDVIAKSVFLGIRFASKQMIEQEPGPSGDPGYVASKHAVMGFTEVSALDCAPHHIHVNALCPGFVGTALISGIFSPQAAAIKKSLEAKHPFRGMGTPQDVARAAVFLASEDAAWVTGIGLPVDGGCSNV